MKQIQKEILGFNVSIDIPETEEELIAAGLTYEKRVELAIVHQLNHSTFGKIRTSIADQIAERLKVQPTDDETIGEFVARIADEKTEQFVTVKADIEAAVSTRLDFTVTRATGATKAASKRWIGVATALKADVNRWNAFAAKHEIDLSELSEEDAINVVALKIRSVILEAQRKAAEQLQLI
jgi:hypothetical protein